MARAKSSRPRRDKAVGHSPSEGQAKTKKKAPRKTKSAVADASVKPSPSAIIFLPETLDSSSAAGIKEQILANRGSPLLVDAGQVRRTGMQAVQVLLAAAQTWRSDGKSYIVANAAEEFLETLALVGLSRQDLFIEGLPG